MWRSLPWRRVLLFVVGTLLGGWGLLAGAGEIADLHRKWVKPKEVDPKPLMDRFDRLNEPKHGVSEIGLERTVCFGTCPVYTVILKSDGTVKYVGEEHVQRKGTRTGRISDWAFNQLAEFVIESKYMELESNYEVPVADMPSAYTTAVVNGKRKLIRNYGDVGPVKLFMLQAAIDGVLAQADWDNEPKANGKPKEPKP